MLAKLPHEKVNPRKNPFPKILQETLFEYWIVLDLVIQRSNVWMIYFHGGWDYAHIITLDHAVSDVAKFEVLCRSDTLAKFGWLDPHFKESPPNMEESHLPTTWTIIPNNGQVSSEHGQLPHGPGPPTASCSDGPYQGSITCQIILG